MGEERTNQNVRKPQEVPAKAGTSYRNLKKNGIDNIRKEQEGEAER